MRPPPISDRPRTKVLSRVLVATALVAATGVQEAAAATIRHVPADYPSIQSALNASTFGDVVLVAPGTYLENLALGPGQNGVQLRSESGPESTVIDGNQQGRVFNCSSLGPLTVIQGFSITGGRVGLNDTGAGLNLSSSHIRLENNIIHGNIGAAGAAVYADNSSPTLIGNVIRDNQAFASGGGIYCDHFSHARIEKNIIARNSSNHYGGGVSIWTGSSPQLVNNTIVSNTGALGGGGVYVTRNSHPELIGNIIAGNNQGDGVRRDDSESTIDFACNDVWNNAPANYSGIADPTGLSGNISVDPLFCNFPVLDLRLDEGSPCAPAHSPPGCGLIGALDVGCGPTAVEPSTWGRLKILGKR